MIKAGLAGDDLSGDFDPQATAHKLERACGPSGPDAGELFRLDIDLLTKRLASVSPDYDIEPVFTKMMEATPELARRYYGIEGFEPTRPRILEYFFEGLNDLYKDGDWFAFNVNSAESLELGVPVGTYFKRNQVTPGHPEFVTLHEANHAMQEKTYLGKGPNHYVPWFDEGLADAMSRMMLVRATGDWKLMELLKALKTEVEVTDARKATYHFSEEIAALMLIRGRLPFVRALMQARSREPYAIDYSFLAQSIRAGVDPHVAAIQSYKGHLERSFFNKLERDEAKFRKDGDLDGHDLRALTMFIGTERPACLEPNEYRAALWLADAVGPSKDQHALVKTDITGDTSGVLVPCSSVSEAAWEKDPSLAIRVVVRQSEVPEAVVQGAKALAAKYIVITKEVGGEAVFDPFGGGLPYRLGAGEIRCSY